MNTEQLWKTGDVLILMWGENRGEKRTVARCWEALSLDDGLTWEITLEGLDGQHGQHELMKLGWRRLSDLAIELNEYEDDEGAKVWALRW